MIVIFGYSPVFGFLNTVQEYHFGEYILLVREGYIMI